MEGMIFLLLVFQLLLTVVLLVIVIRAVSGLNRKTISIPYGTLAQGEEPEVSDYGTRAQGRL